MWLFKRQAAVAIPEPDDPVVTAMKKRSHAAADKATRNANRLNKVFEENGITLNILTLAAGGKGEH